MTFSEQPPVFAKPKQQVPNLPYPVHGPQGGYPPQPGGYPPQPAVYPPQQQPGYPAYPPYQNYGAYPPTTNSYSGGGYPPTSTSYSNPPANSVYPPATGGSNAGYTNPPAYPPTTQSFDQRPGTGILFFKNKLD